MLTDGGSSADQEPSLSSTETLVETLDPAASGRPSPLKSATARDVGSNPVTVVIGGPKLPPPVPRRTVGPPTASRFVTTRSSTRSPFTSAALIESGFAPAAKDCAGWKVPSPL